MDNNRSKGSRYENEAAAFLENKGIKILDRNFRCRLGEIDIIARDSDCLCFVEVKYRKTTANGYPSEAVGPAKRKKIYQVAEVYMKKNGISLYSKCRFDVISILGDKITYYKNAFGSF
ncbi:MAG: YraN family protein [Lachnospiraceae bacterium]|nr:YraN family protein [Lachnospiraceae bacterium]